MLCFNNVNIMIIIMLYMRWHFNEIRFTYFEKESKMKFKINNNDDNNMCEYI